MVGGGGERRSSCVSVVALRGVLSVGFRRVVNLAVLSLVTIAYINAAILDGLNHTTDIYLSFVEILIVKC